jgi:hypothetical protein
MLAGADKIIEKSRSTGLPQRDAQVETGTYGES